MHGSKTWVVVALLAVVLCAAAIVAYLTQPEPEPPVTHREPASAEDVGQSHGRTLRGYLRGVRTGWQGNANKRESK